MPSTKPEATTGLLLAGGEGRRVGGRDKGLLPWRGQPVAAQVLARLAPQVQRLAISANRNQPAYAALAPGVPVWADATPGLGPLGGWLTALRACATPWLVCVPCDAPLLPPDLVARLHAAAAAARAPAACARCGPSLEPMFALLHTRLADDLAAHLAHGGRAARHWLAAVGAAQAPFADGDAFANLNHASDYA